MEREMNYYQGLEDGYNNLPPQSNDDYYMMGHNEGQGHYVENLKRYYEELEYYQSLYGENNC
jgi:hypothetical protein